MFCASSCTRPATPTTNDTKRLMPAPASPTLPPSMCSSPAAAVLHKTAAKVPIFDGFSGLDIPEHISIENEDEPENQAFNGAYGDVLFGVDKKSGTHIALKKIRNAFDRGHHSNLRALRAYRELKVLEHFKEFPHPNVLGLREALCHNSAVPGKHWQHLYLVVEKMDTTLEQAIRHTGHAITDVHVQHIMFQLLAGVHHLHSAGVWHRDLKPANILLNEDDCTLKICDFGLSRDEVDPEDPTSPHATNYVVTRYYRSPELLLKQSYASAVDIWSTGCIYGELLKCVQRHQFAGERHMQLRDRILFRGGDSKTQLLQIVKALNPSVQDFSFLADHQSVRADFRHVLAQSHGGGMDWPRIIPGLKPKDNNLLSQMLSFNPQTRCTAVEALRHEYFVDIQEEDQVFFEELCCGCEGMYSGGEISPEGMDLNDFVQSVQTEVIDRYSENNLAEAAK